MREFIRHIVSSGGSISFPYKVQYQHHLGEAKIGVEFAPILNDSGLPTFYTMIQGHNECYASVDEAVEDYMAKVFRPENIGLGIMGIRKHKLTDKDLDDLTEKQVRLLVKAYFATFFEADFPFAK